MKKSGYNTLKQRRLIQNLPKSKTVMEAALKANYSPTARNMYKVATKRHIAAFLDPSNPQPEEIINVFSELLVEARKDNDLKNALRANENMAKIKAMFTEKLDVKQEITSNDSQSLIDKLYRRGCSN